MSLQVPKLIIEYGLPFDFDPSGEVPKEMATWCHAMTPEFQRLWNEQGRPLLQPIVERFNRGYHIEIVNIFGSAFPCASICSEWAHEPWLP